MALTSEPRQCLGNREGRRVHTSTYPRETCQKSLSTTYAYCTTKLVPELGPGAEGVPDFFSTAVTFIYMVQNEPLPYPHSKTARLSFTSVPHSEHKPASWKRGRAGSLYRSS